MIKVYIAGPLFGSGRSTANVHKAIRAAERIHAAQMCPFVPHLFHYWDTVSPHDDAEYWLSMDRVWLEQCDVMVRLVGESPGSEREEEWCAELGIPIYFEGGHRRGISELVSAFSAGKIEERPSKVTPAQMKGIVQRAFERAESEAPFSLRQLQTEQREWQKRNFGDQPGYRMLLGAMEEIGELAHAHLKHEQVIRGDSLKHFNDKVDAVADAIVFLAGYCNAENIDLQEAVTETWAKVRQRNWVADPENGKAEAAQ